MSVLFTHTSQDAKTSFCFRVSNHLVRHLNAFQILLKPRNSAIAPCRGKGERSGKVEEAGGWGRPRESLGAPMPRPDLGLPAASPGKVGSCFTRCLEKCCEDALCALPPIYSLRSRSSLPQTHRVCVCELAQSRFVYILKDPSPHPPGKFKVTFK